VYMSHEPGMQQWCGPGDNDGRAASTRRRRAGSATGCVRRARAVPEHGGRKPWPVEQGPCTWECLHKHGSARLNRGGDRAQRWKTCRARFLKLLQQPIR